MRAGMLLPLFLALLCACNPNERRKADRAAEDARAKAKQIARDAKRQANEVASHVQTNTTGEAREKLRRGEEDLKQAGADAAVKLDHAALIGRIKAGLARDLGLGTASGISVDANGADVTLTGSVASSDQKAAAERSVRQITGVNHVRDDLTVR